MATDIRFKGRLISFTTKDKLDLEGFLSEPEKKTKTCLVHVHGMTDNLYGLDIVDHLMAVAFKNNMAFFTFNNRGMGTITTFARRHKHLVFRTIGTSFENFKECLYDLDGALKALSEYGYTKFILSGHSTGCQKVTYYQFRKKRKSIKGIILLAPADDYNYQQKLLGKKKSKEFIQLARRLVRTGRGKEIMPLKAEPNYFSAKRYYELYRPGSVEGNLFNYDGKMHAYGSIKIPILSIFGELEEYAVKSPRKMLRILAEKSKHRSSRSVFIKEADHCFCLREHHIQPELDRWLKQLPEK